LLVYSLAPLVWILIASITPELRADSWSSGRTVQFFPSQPTFQNYIDLFANVPFGTYFINSTIVATGTMFVAVLTASLGAYGFVRFRFWGRRTLLFAMLMAYMVPSVVLLVPLLVIFRAYGLINTYPGLILAESTNTAPFVLLLMINYFSSLPRELEEQALVDGCSRLGALWRIVLPLAIPGLVAGGLFAFIAAWNNFLFAVRRDGCDTHATSHHAAVRTRRTSGLGHQRRRRSRNYAAGRPRVFLVPEDAHQRPRSRCGERVTTSFKKQS